MVSEVVVWEKQPTRVPRGLVGDCQRFHDSDSELETDPRPIRDGVVRSGRLFRRAIRFVGRHGTRFDHERLSHQVGCCQRMWTNLSIPSICEADRTGTLTVSDDERVSELCGSYGGCSSCNLIWTGGVWAVVEPAPQRRRLKLLGGSQDTTGVPSFFLFERESDSGLVTSGTRRDNPQTKDPGRRP